MSPPRYAAKRDTSEAGIVESLEGVGCTVIKVSDTDLPDLIVFYRGRCFLLECKTGKAKPRPNQAKFWAELAAKGVHVQLVTTPTEALAAIGFTWGAK